MHALHSGMDVKAYAADVGRTASTVYKEVHAAKVADAVTHMGNDLSPFHRHLEEIHAAPRWLLTALERGMHALHSGMDVKAYAESIGRARTTVHNEVYAADVASAVPHMGNDLSGYYKALVEIHAAPRWLWPALVARMVADSLTVEATRTMVAEVKGAVEPPGWVDLGAAAESAATPGHRSPSMRVFSFGYIGSGAA